VLPPGKPLTFLELHFIFIDAIPMKVVSSTAHLRKNLIIETAFHYASVKKLDSIMRPAASRT
jgi:hypothetical protein